MYFNEHNQQHIEDHCCICQALIHTNKHYANHILHKNFAFDIPEEISEDEFTAKMRRVYKGSCKYCKIAKLQENNDYLVANLPISKIINCKYKLCSQCFKTYESVPTHFRLHFKNGFVCPACPDKMVTKSSRKFVNHLKDVHLKRFVRMCPLCWIFFRSDELIKDHFKNFHKLLKINGFFECHICFCLVEGPALAHHYLQSHGCTTPELQREREVLRSKKGEIQNKTISQGEISTFEELDLEKLLEIADPGRMDIDISSVEDSDSGGLSNLEPFSNMAESIRDYSASNEDDQLNQVRS